MTTLKEQLLRDEAVFLDTEEFAQAIEWNGRQQWFDPDAGIYKPIIAVIEEDVGALEEMGVFSEQLRVFISERSVERPVPEQGVTLNGGSFHVRSVALDAGMLEIVISRIRA